jgi:outer membrane protein assembly factor BamB
LPSRVDYPQKAVVTLRHVLTILLIVTASAAGAEDWPQFRGPSGEGHSAERGVPLEWSETRNVLWKTRVPGSGWSSPVVASGRVWVTAADQGPGASSRVSLRVLAFDAETGRQMVDVEVFRVRNAGSINLKNSRASPTPIIDGDRVYVHYGTDGTAALTTSGDIVWKTELLYDSEHGNGGSPILYGDLLIFSCDGFDKAFVVALDKQTGKVRWKKSRRSPWSQAYSTPLVIRVGDQDQVVSVGAFRAAAYDPSSGEEIWRVSYPDGFSNVPRPVYGHGLVFISTGFNEPSLLAVRADGKGDVTRSHVAWTLRRGAPLTPSPLLVGDLLYVVSDIGIASCLDAKTGKTLWQQRLEGNYSASPILADGRVYFLSEEGVATVIAPGTAFEKLATNVLDGATLASMAVSDRSIFIRTGTHLYRIGSPGTAQQPAADVQTIFDRAVDDFVSGRVAESVTGFDNVARLAPRSAPQLWQRGIALYYAGRYKDCREQFEAHRLVNPNDVENAAWHFLCVARSSSVSEARAGLLPVGPDSRVPMRQIYALLRDMLSPENVLAAAGDRPEAVFYARLYLGLYFEALGNKARALENITEAAADRYRAVGGYMHAVAVVHLGILQPRK